MPTRRARPIPLILCAPLALAAGVALAAQKDVGQKDVGGHELTRAGLAQAGLAGDSAASQPAEIDAPAAIGEAHDERLIAWPCLDAPGCGEPASGVTPSVAARDSAQIEATPIPLPTALGLMGAALTALGLLMRRRRDD